MSDEYSFDQLISITERCEKLDNIFRSPTLCARSGANPDNLALAINSLRLLNGFTKIIMHCDNPGDTSRITNDNLYTIGTAISSLLKADSGRVDYVFLSYLYNQLLASLPPGLWNRLDG